MTEIFHLDRASGRSASGGMRRWLVVMAALIGVCWSLPAQAQERPRNVILFIADGCGPASFTLARDYLRATAGQEQLALDAHLVGSVQTYATNSLVTDSAAGATAFACGVKSYNGAIAVDADGQPVATLLEGAEARGMATGLVATSRITHATPAAFSAHVTSRSLENEIALQQIGQGIDVLFGGGKQQFLPTDQGGRRDDGRDLLAEAAASGYHVVTDRAGFEALTATPAIGLFSDSHMAYEVDRDAAAEPSLAEMTRKAIDLLDDDPDGFFLMVEGSRIDHAAHGNDPAGHLHDILAYDAAVAVALAYAADTPGTLVLATSDHETGGLTLGRDGQYAWRPEVLARLTHSLEPMVAALREDGRPIAEVMRDMAGIEDLTYQEGARIEVALDDPGRLAAALSDVISRRALIGWTTGGHTAVDVNLYAFGPGSEAFSGHLDNTDIGRTLARLLEIDLDALSAALQARPAGDAR